LAGTPCRNRVALPAQLCHVHLVRPASLNQACVMRQDAEGWFCCTHNWASEEWQVLLALGAKVPCRPPGTRSTLEKMALTSQPHTLALLAYHDDPSIRNRVAANQHTPQETLYLLWLTGECAEPLTSNPKCPARILQQYAATPATAFARRNIASNPNSPAAALEKLAFSPGDGEAILTGPVVEMVAEHPNCSQELLTRLADSPTERVLCRLLTRQRTLPAAAIKKLSSHPSPLVQANVAQYLRQAT